MVQPVEAQSFEANLLLEYAFNDVAGVGRLTGHIPLHSALLMVILVIHNIGVAVFKTEGQAPVGRDFHTPMAFQITLQGMKA